MRKKTLFIVCLILMIVPITVNAASITNTSISSITQEQAVGNSFYVSVKASFSGIDRNSSNTKGIYMVAFELEFDDSLLEITGIISDWYDSEVYKEGGKYYILSTVDDDSTGNKCVDNFLACTDYTALVQFHVKKANQTSTDIKLVELDAGIFTVDKESEAYLVDDMEELECISNKVSTIKLKQSDQEVQSKSTIVGNTKPEIKDNKISSSKKATPNTNTDQNNETSNNVSSDSNTYLKTLSIKNYDIEFKKDKFYYNITVKNNVNSLKIKAETEDSNSSYTINGADDLKKNHDKVKIIVTAKNGEQKAYNINIKRLEKNVRNFSDKDANKVVNKLNKIIFIIISIIVVIIILVIAVSHHNKKMLKKLIDKM